MAKTIGQPAALESQNDPQAISINNFLNTFTDQPGGEFTNASRYMSGSRAVIKINDKLFGFAFGVSFNVETQQDEIWTVDDWTAYELAPSKVRVNGTLSMFHVPGKGPTERLVQPNILGFLFHRYITIRIEDQATGAKIFETNRAQVTSKRQVIREGELSRIELQWKAIAWTDVAPYYPGGYDDPSNITDTVLGAF